MVRRFPEPAVWNPCRHRLELTPLEILELAIGAVTLLPLRIIGLLVAWPLSWISIYIATIGLKVGDRLSPWRRQWLFCVATPLVRFCMFFFGFLWVKYTGKRAHHKEVPVNVVAPHSTAYDGLFTGGIVYGSMLTCKEMGDSIVTRPTCIAAEIVLVDRSTPEARAKVKDIVMKFIRDPTRQTHLMAFPEGTCGNGKSLLCFRRGSFIAGVPVQPIVLDFGQTKKLAAWTYDCYSAPMGILLQICRLHTPLEIRFLDPYYPSEAEKKDPTLFANNVQAVMARALGVPYTRHTQEDGFLAYKAMSLGLPSSTGTIECGTVKSALGLSRDELHDQLRRFAAINSAKDGSVTLEQMSEYFAWPIQQHVEALFNEYDTGHYNALTFRDYLFGLVDLAHGVPDKEELQSTIFATLAAEKGSIDLTGVQQLLDASDADVSSNEASALLDRWRVLSGEKADSGLSEDGFMTLVRLAPEYLVFFQWLQHGQSSYPVPTESMSIDEPDQSRTKRAKKDK